MSRGTKKQSKKYNKTKIHNLSATIDECGNPVIDFPAIPQGEYIDWSNAWLKIDVQITTKDDYHGMYDYVLK